MQKEPIPKNNTERFSLVYSDPSSNLETPPRRRLLQVYAFANRHTQAVGVQTHAHTAETSTLLLVAVLVAKWQLVTRSSPILC